jgi:hypothetical protein
MKRTALLLVVASMILSLPASASAATAIVRSPTGNIACGIDKTFVRCDIGQRDWTAPPKPRSCHVDWGNGLILNRTGRASFECAGDTLLGQGRHLPYGQSVRRGRFRCASRTTGMRCVNLRNGHGFQLSRQQARRF